MGRDRVKLAREVFHAALGRSGADRDAIIRERCAGDADLEEQVRAMLCAAEEHPTEAPPPPPTDLDRLFAAETMIDGYRVLELLGEGGFASVYLAEQTEPVRRRVALKVIKRGMETRQVVARFNAERQALAMMDHPGVAKVFDAGNTEDGRPYFVMEHVPGLPITDYCDRARLSIDERLALFVQVCEAVQHAHQKGIIHRDLKPSNILVSSSGSNVAPKVIDFGIAKALSHRLTEQTIFTEQGQIIGTPEYMSPEQVERTAHDIDTRSDIYSLGVLLYELLTGVRPFDLRDAALMEIQRQIVEVDPQKPSTRLTAADPSTETLARQRRLDTRAIVRRVRGDLDWIVMKSLEKDRVRRYETANALAMDIRRHLEDEPVLAGPPSAGYRIGKFVRRNRSLVSALSLGLAALVLGLAGTLWGWSDAAAARDAESTAKGLAERREKEANDARIRADESRQAAEIARDELSEVVDFQARMLADVVPSVTGQRLMSGLRARVRSGFVDAGASEQEAAEELAAFDRLIGYVNPTDYARGVIDDTFLLPASGLLERQFKDDSPAKARLLYTIGTIYGSLGDTTAATPLLQRALQLVTSHSGSEHPDTLVIQIRLAGYYADEERFDDALPLLEESIAIIERTGGDAHEHALEARGRYANVLREAGQFKRAEQEARTALALSRAQAREDEKVHIETLETLAVALMLQEEYIEADALMREVIERAEETLPPDHPRVLSAQSLHAVLLRKQGQPADAEKLWRQIIERRERLLGREHPQLEQDQNNLAAVLVELGRYEEADAILARLAERDAASDTLLQSDLTHLNNLAAARLQQRKYGEAAELFRRSLAGYQQLMGPNHEQTLSVKGNLATALTGQRKYDEAEAMLREVVDARTAQPEPNVAGVVRDLFNLADVLRKQKRNEEALEMVERCIAAAADVLPADHWNLAYFQFARGEVLTTVGRFEEGETAMLQSIEVVEARLGPTHDRTQSMKFILSKVYELNGDEAKAAHWLALSRGETPPAPPADSDPQSDDDS